ncbi:MAG: glycosyl hydrolase-related protein, partial [Candidatus Thorarchaeota archaeon]
PMYILPDEFLVSGESLIRNLLIGHHIAKKFGRVMKAGYIPDPFGHIAQLPQILQGFEIPSVLFWRGFGNEFEDLDLNIEFKWNSPEKASSIIGIFLMQSYGSVADLKLTSKSGIYKSALHKIKRVVTRFEEYTATPFVLLNSGSDHHEAKSEIPALVKQWNELYPDKILEQNDFEYYVDKVLTYKPNMKSFQGELRGGKYAHLLSGVFSARMWIKQRNTAIEYLYEKYTEPISAITWALDKYRKFLYPKNYILTGLKWLIKNHPHDSICGCSIDQVHDEMDTRFDWAEQIGNEIFKNTIIYLYDLISIDNDENKIPIIVFNPLPWKRRDLAYFNIIANTKKTGFKSPENFKIIDSNGTNIPYQFVQCEEEPRYRVVYSISFYCSFLAEVPSCGYKVYYIIPEEKPDEIDLTENQLKLGINRIENQFYLIDVNLKGQISVLDKSSASLYENICFFEDVGDWGDEYDFSGPLENQTDLKFTSEDLNIMEILPFIDGLTQKTLKIRANLNLPASLSEDRYIRDEYLVSNLIDIYITLYKDIKRIDLKIVLENASKDHRIRLLFPSKIKSKKVYCDGHFYVNPRNIELPESNNWAQKPLPTNHQKDFISVSDNSRTFSVLNKGLPEYEAIINNDGTITLAVTLLRCIEWLSRHDFASRRNNAGPDLNTPKAQCIGKHTFELSLVIEENKPDWLTSETHIRGKEFNNPFYVIAPSIMNTSIRASNKIVLKPFGIISYFSTPERQSFLPYLPSELSFLDIDNNHIVISALKKAEESDDLIVRFYNISPKTEEAKISFCNFLQIQHIEIVNFLEEKPVSEIKAILKFKTGNAFTLIMEPHVITTVKVKTSLVP